MPENSEKADALNRLAETQFNIDKEASEKAARQALELALSLNYLEGQTLATVRIGMCLSAKRNYTEAIELFKDAITLSRSHRFTPLQILALSKLGNAYLFTAKYIEALDCYKQGIALAEQINDEASIADLYTNSGAIYQMQGSYTEALNAYFHCLNAYEDMGNESRIASTCNNIGIIYLEQKCWEDALTYFKRAHDIRLKLDEQKALSDTLNNMGAAYSSENKFHEALDYYQKAQRIREQTGDQQKLASSYINIGRIYKQLGQAAISIGYYETALDYFLKTNEKRGLAQTYVSLGDIYLEKRDYEKAEDFLLKAEAASLEGGYKNYLRESFLSLSTLYATQNKFEQAYLYYVKYNGIDKELSSAETARHIAQLGMRNEIEQKEKTAALERKKNEELKQAFLQLEEAKKRSEELLHNILPEETAREIKENGKALARYYESATVMFCDITGFTTISEQLAPQLLINCIDTCYSKFDEIVERYGVEKIKVIGDSYMCASGLPIENTTHALDMLKAVFEMHTFSEAYSEELRKQGMPAFRFRFGVHTGALVSGVVGHKKFAYDIWGDTVNIAARMEQSSEPGKINISEATYQLVKEHFTCTHRGKIQAKNKGEIDMYFVVPAFPSK